MIRYAVIEWDELPEGEGEVPIEGEAPLDTGPPSAGTVTNLAEASETFAAERGWIACGDDVAPGWRWDGAAFSAPVVALEDRKTALRNAVNAIKLARQNSVAPTPVGPVDCDTESRNKLNGAVLMAMLAMQASQPFALQWTLADNSNVDLDGAGMIAMASAVGVYVAACHAHAQTLKAALAEASDHAALDEIDINTGWPEV